MDKTDTKQSDQNDELEFDENDLAVVEISDSTLEQEDQRQTAARKEAKKLAKQLQTPEEKKAQNRKRMLIAAGVTAVIVAILMAVPFTRWPLLNAIGLRGNLQVTLQEDGSKQPIARASLRLDDGSLTNSDSNGVATFSQARLGKRTVIIQKAGYGDAKKVFTNGLGTSRAKASLKVIGIKLDVDIKDWLSGNVLEGATVSYKESTAKSDKTGSASIVIPPTDQAQIQLKVSADGYITKTLNTEVNVESREVSLVSAQKNYFVSKRDGNFDIFSSNLDGSSQQKIIEATGKEDGSLLQFSINRNNKQAILVANREGKVTNGKVIAGIYLVDLQQATLKKIDEASDVQLLDWADSVIAYTKTIPSLNYDDANLTRLTTYNPANGKLADIAQANYFSISMVAQNKAFYLPADAYRTVESGVLTSLDLTSGAKRTYLTDKLLRYATRASFTTINLQDSNGSNYELQLGSGVTKSVDTRPPTGTSFALSPNSARVISSDRRDGQGALIIRDIKSAQDKTVVKVGGLTTPVRFISDDLAVVRVVTSQETADYIVSITSGKIGKIVDVTNISQNAGGL